MSLEQFLSNNRGINVRYDSLCKPEFFLSAQAGADVPPELLASLYHAITQREIKLGLGSHSSTELSDSAWIDVLACSAQASARSPYLRMFSSECRNDVTHEKWTAANSLAVGRLTPRTSETEGRMYSSGSLNRLVAVCAWAPSIRALDYVLEALQTRELQDKAELLFAGNSSSSVFEKVESDPAAIADAVSRPATCVSTITESARALSDLLVYKFLLHLHRAFSRRFIFRATWVLNCACLSCSPLLRVYLLVSRG